MERKFFISSLFRSRKDLNKEVKQRREESSIGTMLFPFKKEDKLHRDGGHLDHEILSEYLSEYKSKSRAFKEALALPHFIQLEEGKRPYSYGMMRGNRFVLTTFYGSLKCAEKTWVMKLEAFCLLHPVVEREVVEIATLHLEGEANVWWFNHLSHSRVSTLAELSKE